MSNGAISDVWRARVQKWNKFDAMEMKCLRSICNVIEMNRTRNEEVRRRLIVTKKLRVIELSKRSGVLWTHGEQSPIKTAFEWEVEERRSKISFRWHLQLSFSASVQTLKERLWVWYLCCIIAFLFRLPLSLWRAEVQAVRAFGYKKTRCQGHSKYVGSIYDTIKIENSGSYILFGYRSSSDSVFLQGPFTVFRKNSAKSMLNRINNGH